MRATPAYLGILLPTGFIGLLLAAALAAEAGLDLRSRCLLWPTAPLTWEGDLADRIDSTAGHGDRPHPISVGWAGGADRVGTVRIDLASQGLPAQAKGYELFDEPGLGSTHGRRISSL